MEAIGRRERVALVFVCLGALVLGAVGSWVLATLASPEPPRTPAAPAVAREAPPPGLDLAHLYDLDHLVLAGDPVLDLAPLAAVGSAPPGSAPVPEPAPATLWIPALAALCALYLPAGSW